MFDTIKLYLPNVLKIDIMPDVEVVQENNGQLAGFLTLTAPATVTGTAGAGAQFAAAAGAVITWRTNTLRHNRRIRGRSFIVPIANTGFATDGTLDAGLVTALTTQAGLVADAFDEAQLTVWARPTPIMDENGEPTGLYNEDGLAAFVTGHTVPDMGAILRSRRD
jgi:hypothetical protein